jgi:hypothetical protein
MFVGAETVAGVGFDAARAGLVSLVRGGWMADASGRAFEDLGRGMARVGPAPGVSRLAEVHFGEIVTRGQVAVLPLRWQAAGLGEGLFPVMDADITMAPFPESQTLIALTGAYRPPLGPVGATLDRVVLRRVADATVRRFVNRIGQAVADPASAIALATSREQGDPYVSGPEPRSPR